MSDDTAQQLMEMYDKWDSKERRRNFIARMEHKLHNKEQHRDRSSRW